MYISNSKLSNLLIMHRDVIIIVRAYLMRILSVVRRIFGFDEPLQRVIVPQVRTSHPAQHADDSQTL